MNTCAICHEPIVWNKRLNQWMHASIARIYAPVHRIVVATR